MTLMRVDADTDGRWCAAELAPTLDALPEASPVTVLIHGFRFCSSRASTDPHNHILSIKPALRSWKAVSWPRHLHLDRPGAGLGIAFGWPALGALPRIAARAERMGAALAAMITTITDRRPDIRVNLFAHSLGARVALSGMAQAPAASIGKAILLSGADYRERAIAALDSPAGRTAAVLNVTSRENLPFDAAFRLAVPAPRLSSLPLSAGLSGHVRWTDLRIDCPKTNAILGEHGHRLRRPDTRFCHWSGYLRPGLFGLYRHVLDPADPGFLSRLRADLARPAHSAPGRGEGAALSPL